MGVSAPPPAAVCPSTQSFAQKQWGKAAGLLAPGPSLPCSIPSCAHSRRGVDDLLKSSQGLQSEDPRGQDTWVLPRAMREQPGFCGVLGGVQAGPSSQGWGREAQLGSREAVPHPLLPRSAGLMFKID